MNFRQLYSFDTFAKLFETVNTIEADRAALREEVERLREEIRELKGN